MSEQIKTWRIGELAKQTGVTVRTLRHYDHVKLLSPSSRTSGGHRCYTNRDVVQLQSIITLRSCGLSLQEIAAVLSARTDGVLPDLLRRRLNRLDGRIRVSIALRRRLRTVLDALGRRVKPPITEILHLIEETATMNHVLSVRQLKQLTKKRARQLAQMSTHRRASLTKQMQQAWAALSREEQVLLLEQRRAMLPIGERGDG